MKSYFVLFASVALSTPLFAQESAHVTLNCTSLRFSPATSSSQTLSLTTDQSLNEINNELQPVANPSLPGYGALFVLADPTSPGSITGQVFFDAPPPVDVNGDGFDDFLELSQGVAPTITQGVYSTAVDQGTVTANWSRSAGSSTGTCTVQMKSQTFGQLTPFTFTFELLTYTGALTYTPAANSITGFLSLTNVESSSNTLTGAVTLIRVANNKFNDLTLLPGALTNAATQTLTYQVEDIQRDLNLKTNYYGYLDFADGDLTTSAPDYLTWVLSIDDPNDSNGNGIPDLSDDPGAALPPRPTLDLARNGNQLLLSIRGATGTSYALEEEVSLGQTNWQKTVSLTLTNNPQLVTLLIPPTATRFWRLRTP